MPGYDQKACFFDAQVDAPWATDEYGVDEMGKLDRLFSVTGALEGMTVLEPGCGTGRLTEVLASKVGPSGRVLAMDISPKMFRAARQRVTGFDQVTLHLGAVETVPLASECFDLVICHQVFPHLEEKQRAVAMFSRGLKKGGRLIICHFISLAAINDVHRKAGTAVARDMMPGMDVMRRLFTAEGLTIEEITDDERGYFLCAVKK